MELQYASLISLTWRKPTTSRGARLVPCVPGGVTSSSDSLRAFLTVAESAHHNSLEMRLVP
jgi:hypothetical protein